ncbi:arrestin (or S-antigen), N-terminal domain protein [Geosmithia morbida]|uniref:Arrestin (Or S-antigen), N-terminal domain protein n=1 Tax=Geosmithia morbida TaxID=1094350 RepID=A0A9P4Z0L8_9HYPO|nr:arrestin (or S-antigen), N-terminal domain protein [Geosmithia morbida]KAF4125227.1 arrestin (or S-antigen), N-terminal domain protein [Geosmithia morbida]
MSNVFDAASRGPARSKAAPVSVDVRLDQHFTARVYTSGSTVRGSVSIVCQRDTPFESVDVVLIGTTATRLDFVQSYTSSAVRNFIKMRMPIAADALPRHRTLEAGRTYAVPFDFVVPHQLTVNACDHGCTAPAVQDQHLRLPPTLGYWDGDDQAPNVTHVEYAVRARLFGAASRTTTTTAAAAAIETPLLAEAKKIIKVLPASPEEPPLAVTRHDERYCLVKTKPIRKNLVGPKAGELTVEAAQPRALMIHPDGFGANPTEATVRLRWTASASAADADAPPPPKIHSVASKLVSTTFFGSAPSSVLPNLGPKTTYTHNQILSYSVTTNLATTRPDRLAWSVEQSRRDSGYMSGSSPDAAAASAAAATTATKMKGSSSSSSRSRSYSASIDIPVSVPISNKKAFVPTFYNCLISRTYTLQLVLSVGPANTTLTLNVPLQLGVESRVGDPAGGPDALPSFESAVAQDEEAEADEYLRPRIIRQPRGPAQMTGSLPGYGDVTGRSVAAY